VSTHSSPRVHFLGGHWSCLVPYRKGLSADVAAGIFRSALIDRNNLNDSCSARLWPLRLVSFKSAMVLCTIRVVTRFCPNERGRLENNDNATLAGHVVVRALCHPMRGLLPQSTPVIDHFDARRKAGHNETCMVLPV
jgi:hypothetical protein